MIREFVVISNHGRTSGNFKDLMKAGRLDIVVHSIINAFFVSHTMRQDVKLHVLLKGPPDPVKHIEFFYHPEMPISKKDVGNLLRSTLWKYKQGKVVQAFPGINIEKKSLNVLIKELASQGKEIFVLDRRGENLETLKFKNPVFVIGDHEGIQKQDMKFLKQYAKCKISLGKVEYFTSQCITIINYLLDKRQF